MAKRISAHGMWKSGNPYLPDALIPPDRGVRPSIQAVLALIDTDDPAWPGVAAVLSEFTDAGIEIDANAASMAVKLGRHRWASDDRNRPVQLTLATSGSIVYYLRRGPLIKIGTTIQPRKRFGALMPDEILAVEPGDRQQETARHLQFGHLRVDPRSEYFHDAPELREHIEGILAMYGEPDTSWPATGTRLERWPLVLAKSTALITTAGAQEQLGIKRNTVHAWVNRGRIHPAGRNERGHVLFYRDHLIQLRDAPRKPRRKAASS